MVTSHSSSAVEKMAGKYFALSSETRLRILQICHNSPTTIKKIIKLLDMNPNNVTAHVKILHSAGLVEKIKNKDNSVTVKSLIHIDKEGIVRF